MTHRRLAAGDFETDPFKYGREIQPFAAEFFNGEIREQFWGDDCVTKFVDFLAELRDPHICYFHNGGRFDFYLGLLPYFSGNIKIINRRIVKANIGIHEFRDSWAIMPERLEDFASRSGV